MFIDKRNLYSIFFLSVILILVLFFSRFSNMEGLTTTPVVNANTNVSAATKPVEPVATTTPVIQATTPPTVTSNPKPTTSKPINNLASIIETPTVSTATIVKIADIQAQVANLGTILQTDVVNAANTGMQTLQNPALIKALTTISDKTVLKEIDTLIQNGQKIYMNLILQTMQIQNNLQNFTKQYQNL